ncbi:MAG: N-acetylmuramoyl-L-alanine amidase, partial [Bacillota bacterium]|nr:N-acetylmuramoyl-L-alanine amidase [Bacillota bacterium]
MKKKNIITILILISIMIFTACNDKVSKNNNISTASNKTGNLETNMKTANKAPTAKLSSNKKANTGKSNIKAPKKTAKPLSSSDKTPSVKINSKKVIVIDPGHSSVITSKIEPISPGSEIMKAQDTMGACGINSKLPEYALNLKVALKLGKLLENEGFKVILTKTANSQELSNIERAEIGNKNNADLVIRIHADSFANTSVSGATMLVPGDTGYAKNIYQISRKYGEVIMSELVKKAGMKSRGITVRNDLTGFNWSKVPVVLIEMGFLSNPNEDKLLSTDTYESKI